MTRRVWFVRTVSNPVALWVLVAIALAACFTMAGREKIAVWATIFNGDEWGTASVHYDRGGGFRDDAMVKTGLRPGLHTYEFIIPASRIRQFKLHIASKDPSGRLKDLTIGSRTSVVRAFTAQDIQAGSDRLEIAVVGPREMSYRRDAAATEAVFLVSNSAIALEGHSLSSVGATLVTGLLLACLLLAPKPRSEPASPWPAVGLAAALGLALAMAGATSITSPVSPDEYLHASAAAFYNSAWLPPAPGDPLSLPSYSAFGFSYLNEYDIVYFLAGKFTVALSFLPMDETYVLRLFNLVLLATLVLRAAVSRAAALVIVPMLCTPQAWYLFSYFNADAFALTATSLLAATLADLMWPPAESESPARQPHAAHFLWLSLLWGAALLSKVTFYPACAFLGLAMLWGAGLRRAGPYVLLMLGFAAAIVAKFGAPIQPDLPGLLSPGQRWTTLALALGAICAFAWYALRSHAIWWKASTRLLVVPVMIGFAILVLRVGFDYAVMGGPGPRGEALQAIAEEIAVPELKPSNVGTARGFWGAALAARGIGFEALIRDYGWAELIANSSLGVYGYMSLFAAGGLYDLQFALLAGALLLFGLAHCRNHGPRGECLLAVGLSGISILLALMYSWTIGFQAQGRYLFGILPMFGYVMALGTSLRIYRVPGTMLVGALWAMGVFSFVMVGLRGLTHP